VLPALPLNHNLKVDRNALPQPTIANLQHLDTELSAPPSTPTERRLAEIWRSALAAERVGVNDTFFDLGGTSLSALQLIATVDRELGVRLTGLELLREPLGVLSSLIDERSGRATSELGSASGGSKDQLCLFHFGAGGALFGALHGPPGPAATAALICGPVGHEHVRAHFVLQRLARQLAASGVPTLRFDYYGCQDSLGDSDEASCARWQRDILAAHAELTRRTEATRVVAIGVRLGASLLRSVLPNLPGVRVVQWDPIERPSQYLDRLSEAHRDYVRTRPGLRQRLRARWPSGAARELLGARYSRSLLNELRRLPLTEAGEACLRTDCAWLDLSRLEDMLPDEGISRALARLALEAR
jgi:acyl carrier protein